MITHPFKQNILNRTLSQSVGLRTFLIESTGLEDFTRLNESDLDKYYNTALEFLEAELGQIGIRTIDTIDFVTDIEAVSCASIIREAFSVGALVRILSQSDTVRENIENVIENNDYAPDMLITQLIERFHTEMPISEMWRKLDLNKFSFINSALFVKHVISVLDMEPKSNDTNTKALAEYVKELYMHVNDVKTTIAALTNLEEIDVTFSDYNFNNYDRDLGHIPPEAIFMYSDKSNLHPVFRKLAGDIPLFAIHKENTDHHFEYYIKRGVTTMQDSQILKLVGEYCIPGWSLEVRLALFTGMLAQTKLDSATQLRIKEIVGMSAQVGNS